MLLDAYAVNSRVEAYRRSAGRTRTDGPPARDWLVGVAARMRSHALDRALIDGADPAASPQLSVHAARITSPAGRYELAEFLDRLGRSEHEPRTLARLHPHRRAVRANSIELHALAALLRGSGPVYPRGVARLRLLVRDGTGPAYTDREGSALDSELGAARMAIRA